MNSNIYYIEKGQNAFKEKNVKTEMKDLYGYDVVLFEIVVLGEKRYVDIRSLPDLSNLDMSFFNWMSGSDYSALPYILDKDLVNKKTLKQYTLNFGVYNPFPKNAGSVSSIREPDLDARDVAISLADRASHFYDNCLMSINGYIHRADIDGDLIYVLNGNDIYRRTGKAEFSFLDYELLGGIRTFDVTIDNIKKHPDSLYMSDAMLITMPEPIDEETTAFICFLGKIYYLNRNKNFKLVSDHVVKFSPGMMQEQILLAEKDGLINLRELGIKDEDGSYIVNELRSDVLMQKLIQLNHIFIGKINSPNLRIRSREILPVKNSNRYVTYDYEYEPVVDQYGRLITLTEEETYSQDSVLRIDHTVKKPNYRIDDAKWYHQDTVKLKVESYDSYSQPRLFQLIVSGA